MKAPLTSLLALALIVSSSSAQNFTPPRLIAGLAPSEVCSSDLDNDGDADLVAAAYGSVVWFENLGSSMFGAAQTIATNTSFAWGVHAADLDGDGDADVLTADWGTAAIGTVATARVRDRRAVLPDLWLTPPPDRPDNLPPRRSPHLAAPGAATRPSDTRSATFATAAHVRVLTHRHHSRDPR
jgi:hypothetical protein